MNEPEAVIDPEAVAPSPRSPRRRRTVVAGATALALVAGIAFAAGGGSDPQPLALVAGNAAGGSAETMAARSGTPAPAAQDDAGGGRAALLPAGGWGLKFEVVGQLPDLPDRAAAWRVSAPELGRADVVRIAEALGVAGSPTQRDGGWFVENADWTLSLFGGAAGGKGGPWYVNLSRTRFDGTTASDPAGPEISRGEAGNRVRALLDTMGAPQAPWKVETVDTEIHAGWACAAGPGLTPEEMRRLEVDKARPLEREAASKPAGDPARPADRPVSNSASTVVDPAPPTASASGRAAGGGSAGASPAIMPEDGRQPDCPPPPAPMKGFNVNFHPELDGRRADWPVWTVTVRADGRIESVHGSWVSFEKGDTYKLRSVDEALKELQSPGVAYATDQPAVAVDGREPALDGEGTPPPAAGTTPAVAPAESAGAGVSGRRPLPSDTTSSPVADVDPAPDFAGDTPLCPPAPMPMPVEDDAKTVAPVAAACRAPEPPVVKITGVELGLLQTSVYEDGAVRLMLVPSYRFTGHLDGGSPWETSVVALHRDAIAPPPGDLPVRDGTRAGG